MDNLTLTENEEKALVGILYNHVTYATTMEIFGELTEDGVKRIDGLREILGKLFKKYNLTDTLTEEAYLLLGLTEFIQKESFDKWIAGSNMHLKKRAEYFVKKHHG